MGRHSTRRAWLRGQVSRRERRALWVPCGPEDKPAAAALRGACCLPALSFSLLRHGRSRCTRFISPLSPPRAPTAAEGRPLSSPARASPARGPRPTGPADARPARALPDFAAGSEPAPGGHNPWAAESGGSRAGTLDFPSPAFLSLPTGMCSSSSRRLTPRASTAWGAKKLQIPACPATKAGAAWCWAFWCRETSWGLTKGRVRSGGACEGLGS